MEYIVRGEGAKRFIEISDMSFIIENEQDALDLAALCVENETSYLLLNNWNLDDNFFDLTTGLAGAVLQKFSNYRVGFVAIVPEEKLAGRFGEMARESNRGRQFRFFTFKNEAESWITEGKPLR